MAKKRMLMELGMGSSLRKQDYTRAACRALEDALWHNSVSIAGAFGLDRSAMIIEVDVAVQRPEQVDTEKGSCDIALWSGIGKGSSWWT